MTEGQYVARKEVENFLGVSSLAADEILEKIKPLQWLPLKLPSTVVPPSPPNIDYFRVPTSELLTVAVMLVNTFNTPAEEAAKTNLIQLALLARTD